MLATVSLLGLFTSSTPTTIPRVVQHSAKETRRREWLLHLEFAARDVRLRVRGLQPHSRAWRWGSKQAATRGRAGTGAHAGERLRGRR